MDFNTYTAHQTHHRRSEELVRVTELRRRAAERGTLRDAAAAAPTEAAPDPRWHRMLVRWHVAPRHAH